MLAQDGLAECDQPGKNPLKYYDWELNPGHREERQWDSFILPLSYRDWQVIKTSWGYEENWSVEQNVGPLRANTIGNDYI